MSKYSASGTTHSNGIGATFALRFAETVTSNADAHPDSNSHNAIRHSVGGATVARLAAASLSTARRRRTCLLF